MSKYVLPEGTGAKAQEELLQNMVWAFRSWWNGWFPDPKRYEEFMQTSVDLDDLTVCPVCCRKRRKSRAKVSG